MCAAPVEKGRSVVQVKGSTIRAAVTAYREWYPEECEKVLKLLDPETREIIVETQPNQWAPMEAFIRYLQAQVDVTGVDADALHTYRSEFVCAQQFRGLYKAFIKLASPESLLKRLPVLQETFFRGTSVEAKVVEKGKAVFWYKGFEKGHRLIEPIMVGFFRKLLQLNGARDPTAVFTLSIGAGQEHAELVLTWR